MYPRSGFVGVIALAALLTLSPAAPARAADDPPAPALITLQAQDTPVIDILDLLAGRSGLNIVAGPAVTGRTITLKLQSVPFDEALALVARASGLGYERIGDSILVADPQRLSSATGTVARVFDLNYADAEQVREILETVCPEIRADVRGNRVVVKATRAAVEEAARVVAELDAKPQQVMLEARLIEVNTTALEELGIDWSTITKWSTVITEGNQGVAQYGQIPEEMPFLGLNDSQRLNRQVAAWRLSVDALLTDGTARLLSNSNVVTVDGQPAEIFAGETVPVVVTSLQSPSTAGGVLQTVQLEKIDVGVRLNITPRIGEDGLITTLVEPEVSRIIAFVGPDNDLPQTSTRRARTLVRVADGEKIYLGGLIIEEKRETVESVPLLGSLPLLGGLFRHTRKETVKLDLVMEITPRIVGDSGALLPTTARLNPAMDQDPAFAGRPDRSVTAAADATADQ
jgi:type IV pilus assembly protein PilQ